MNIVTIKKIITLLMFILLFSSLGFANRAPVLKDVETQIAIVDQWFELRVDAFDTDNNKLMFSDDTPLFDINKDTGIIRFIPNLRDTGVYYVNISVNDGLLEDSKSVKFIIGQDEAKFSVDREMLLVLVKYGDVEKKTIKIKNTGTRALNIGIVTNLANVDHNKRNFTLHPDNEESVEFTITSTSIGAEVGRIEISAGKIKKIIPLIVETESSDLEFAITTNIYAEFREMTAGGNLTSIFSIVNLETDAENIKETVVGVSYSIKDLENNIIYSENESVRMITNIPLTRSFQLPPYLKSSDYVLIATVKHDNSTGVSSQIFTIIGEEVSFITMLRDIWPYILIIILAASAGFMIRRNYMKIRSVEKHRTKRIDIIYKKFIESKDSAEQARETRRRLLKELELLERAYKLKYIRKTHYIKARKKVLGMLRNVNRKFK